MTELWVDFRGVAANWDTFVTALKKRGISGVIRYIDAGSDSKQIHRAEYQAYVRGDIKVLLVDELGTGDAWDAADDWAAGVARAKAARADARGEGIPDSVAIFCAADAHASGRQVTDAVAYATGFASVLGKSLSGFYGFVETSVAVHNAGVVSLHWRCGGKPSTADQAWLTFWQRNTGTEVIGGIDCDINERYIPEDDVSAADVFSFKPADGSWTVGGSGTFEHWVAFVAQMVDDIPKITASTAALQVAVAAEKGIDPVVLQQMIDTAVAAHTPSVEQVAATLMPGFTMCVKEVLGADQAELADEIVKRMGQVMAGGAR